jgi:hypothetical protein
MAKLADEIDWPEADEIEGESLLLVLIDELRINAEEMAALRAEIRRATGKPQSLTGGEAP